MISIGNILGAVQRLAIDSSIEEIDDSLESLTDQIDGLAYEAAEEAKEFWINEAGKFLDTTRKKYQDTIDIYEDFTEGGVVVGMSTEDKFILTLEEGNASYDMKPELLNGLPSRVIPIGGRGDMRTVSLKSDAGSWIYPAKPGLHIAEEVEIQLEDVIIPKLLGELIK